MVRSHNFGVAVFYVILSHQNLTKTVSRGSAFLSQRKDQGGKLCKRKTKGNNLFCRKVFSDVLDGVASKIFPGGKPSDSPVSSHSLCMFN